MHTLGVHSAPIGTHSTELPAMKPVRFGILGAARIAPFALIKHAHTMPGVELHTGTDASVPNVVPGASLHEELALWVRAGVAPEAALEASTRTSPRYLGLDEAGVLAVGARADLALFGRDPTRDPAALDSFLGVVAGGRVYTRDELLRRLERYVEHYDGFAYGRVFLPSLRGTLRAVTALLSKQAP